MSRKKSASPTAAAAPVPPANGENFAVLKQDSREPAQDSHPFGRGTSDSDFTVLKQTNVGQTDPADRSAEAIYLPGRDTYDSDFTVLKQTSVGQTYPLHTHAFHEYFLVTGGRALHVVNDAIQIVARGSLVFMRPHDVHCYKYYQSQDFTFYNVGLPRDITADIDRLYHGQLKEMDSRPLPRHVRLPEVETRRMEDDLNRLIEEEPGGGRDTRYAFVLSCVAYFILTLPEYDGDSRLPEWLVALLDEMGKPENFIVGLPRLIELANYSQEYVNREFRRFLHTTPTRYINEQRLIYASKLLTGTELPIVEVAEQCGFQNLSYFYARFKEYYGYPPSRERRGK